MKPPTKTAALTRLTAGSVAADCTIDAHGHGNPVQALALQGRHWVQRRLEVDLIDSPEIMAVIDGVVLGLRGESLRGPRFV